MKLVSVPSQSQPPPHVQCPSTGQIINDINTNYGASWSLYIGTQFKPFPNSRLFNDADYLIIGNTIIGNNLKNNFYLTKNNPLNLELFSFEEVLEIKAKYNIQNVVFTHLEEDWGKSYDDYLNLEKECIAVKFAYDGMTIEL